MSAYSQIYNEIKKFNFPSTLANLIAAQAAHETGGFTSEIYNDCLNCFGYKSGSIATACPGHSAYKLYITIEQSADEVANWILRRQAEGNFPADLSTITDADTYANLLKANGYFEDTASNYANGIEGYLQPLPSIAAGGYIAAGLLLFYLLMKRA